MKKFIINSLVFVLLGIVLGEVTMRVFNLTIDVPRSYQAANKLIKYYPGQEGKFIRGTHEWQINKYGYAGNIPKSWNNLVLILGDSYVENFMNPLSCHQDVYLKKQLPEFNFFEAGRSGAAILELLEMGKELDSLNPQVNLLYVHSSDFIDCLPQSPEDSHITFDPNSNKLQFDHYTESKFKDVVYNFKFGYYFYRNVWLSPSHSAEAKAINSSAEAEVPVDGVKKLLQFISKKYTLNNKVLIFRPGSDRAVVKLCADAGFKTYLLQGNPLKWRQSKDDSHWSCQGHEEAAKQVKSIIEENIRDYYKKPEMQPLLVKNSPGRVPQEHRYEG